MFTLKLLIINYRLIAMEKNTLIAWSRATNSKEIELLVIKIRIPVLAS